MRTSKLKYDWLTINWKVTNTYWYDYGKNADGAMKIARRVCADLKLPLPVLLGNPPKGVYLYSFKCLESMMLIDIPDDLKQQGVKLTFSGAAVARLPDPAELVRQALAVGARITRVDAALDLIDSGIDAPEQYRIAKASYGDNFRRGVKVWDETNNKGISVGARSSDYHLRVYHKGLERGVADDWLRVELEAKGRAAIPVAQQIDTNPTAVVAKMRDMLTVAMLDLHTALLQLSEGEEAIHVPVPPRSPARQKWMYQQVLPAFKTWLEEDPPAAMEFEHELRQLVQSLIE